MNTSEVAPAYIASDRLVLAIATGRGHGARPGHTERLRPDPAPLSRPGDTPDDQDRDAEQTTDIARGVTVAAPTPAGL